MPRLLRWGSEAELDCRSTGRRWIGERDLCKLLDWTISNNVSRTPPPSPPPNELLVCRISPPASVSSLACSRSLLRILFSSRPCPGINGAITDWGWARSAVGGLFVALCAIRSRLRSGRLPSPVYCCAQYLTRRQPQRRRGDEDAKSNATRICATAVRDRPREDLVYLVHTARPLPPQPIWSRHRGDDGRLSELIVCLRMVLVGRGSSRYRIWACGTGGSTGGSTSTARAQRNAHSAHVASPFREAFFCVQGSIFPCPFA